MADRQGFEEAALERIGQQLDPMADAAASTMGMPPGGQKYSEREQLEMWNYSPIASPQVRVEAMLELKSLGKTDEEITDALYPNRRKLITTSRPTISAQIQYAKQMDRLMDKKAAEMSAAPPMEEGFSPPAGPEPMPVESEPAPEPAQPYAPEIAPTPSQPSILDQPISMMGDV